MIQSQLEIFTIYLFGGILISAIFDFFRSLRKVIKTSSQVTLIEDIIFWIFAGIVVFILVNRFSYGELRIYTFGGTILGALTFYAFISKLFIKTNVKILNSIKKVIKIFLKIINKPICFILVNMKKLSIFFEK